VAKAGTQGVAGISGWVSLTSAAGSEDMLHVVEHEHTLRHAGTSALWPNVRSAITSGVVTFAYFRVAGHWVRWMNDSIVNSGDADV